MTRKKTAGLSIKYKFLALLVLLPTATLGLYLMVSIDLFKSDKVIYVFDSTAAVSKTLAAQAQAELSSMLSGLKPLLEGFDFQARKFSPASEALFQKQSSVKWLAVFSADDPKTALAELGQKDFQLDTSTLQELQGLACQNEVALRPSPVASQEKEDVFYVAYCKSERVPGGVDAKHVVVGAVTQPSLGQAFKKGSVYSNYLISPKGQRILGPPLELGLDFAQWGIFEAAKNSKLTTVTQETSSPLGTRLIASLSLLSAGGLMSLSFVEKDVALQAVKTLLLKSILFFFAIVFFAVIVSTIGSNKLTATLRELEQATNQVAEGHFDAHVTVRSSDEIGQLAANFNRMAAEVLRLMQENTAKIRMEKELETARLVQETLLPPASFVSGSVQISGFYSPASECGGDWWHYNEIGNKTFLWIGDVTGHGASAALITSAVKATATVLEGVQSLTPATALSLLNKVIYRTAKGTMHMTFFVAAYDKTTQELTYACASHNPPFLVRSSKTSLSRQDFEPLDAVNDLRLGQKADTRYKETKTKIASGDYLLFYTDGILDLGNPGGQPWGERNFIKSAIAAYAPSGTAEEFVSRIEKDARQHRGDAALVDDVTFFACKIAPGMEVS